MWWAIHFDEVFELHIFAGISFNVLQYYIKFMAFVVFS